jgi:hypothetical protein
VISPENPGRVPPERYPWWVKWARLGARSKASQFMWFGIEVALTVLLLFFAVFDTGRERIIDIVLAIWAATIAVMSLATIWWIDKYGTWEQK